MKEKFELDKYDLGIIINSLNQLRNSQIRDNQPTDAIDELLLKIILLYENTVKKKDICKMFEER